MRERTHVSASKPALRTRLDEARERFGEVELIFSVEGRRASVMARPGSRASFTFPHNHTEFGESLGDGRTDQALVNHARTVVAVWNGQRLWARLDADVAA